MSKKVLFATKPGAAPAAAPSADAWVETRSASASAPVEKMKRLTLDISEGLHRRIKMQCADRGVKIADEIRALLEERFPASNS